MTLLSTFGAILTLGSVAYLALGALDSINRRYHPGETDGPIAFGALFTLGYWVAFTGTAVGTVMVYGSLPPVGKVAMAVVALAGAVGRGIQA